MLLQSDSGLAGISSLGNLVKLDASSNQIGASSPTINTEIFYLTTLQDLILHHNDLPALSTDIAWLSNLAVIDLSHNCLETLPAELGNLYFLKKLDLRENRLTSLPDEMANLANLTELNLSHNQITTIPTSFAALYSLKDLHLSFNLIEEIPLEIFGIGEPVAGEDGQEWIQGMFALKELRLRENLIASIFCCGCFCYLL